MKILVILDPIGDHRREEEERNRRDREEIARGEFRGKKGRREGKKVAVDETAN